MITDSFFGVNCHNSYILSNLPVNFFSNRCPKEAFLLLGLGVTKTPLSRQYTTEAFLYHFQMKTAFFRIS